MSSHTCQYKNQSSFLWDVLYLYFVKHSIDDAIRLISSMYEQRFDFSANIEKILLNLWETREISQVFDMARAVIEQKLLDLERHVFIVAALVHLKELSVADAAHFLSAESPRDYANLDDRVKRVIDVAWLVTEDSKDQIMLPNDDGVLEEALREARALFEAS